MSPALLVSVRPSVTTSGLCVLAQLGDVGELGSQCGDELHAGGEVVALLADVGV